MPLAEHPRVTTATLGRVAPTLPHVQTSTHRSSFVLPRGAEMLGG